jgi:hypothetical protein
VWDSYEKLFKIRDLLTFFVFIRIFNFEKFRNFFRKISKLFVMVD